MLKVGWLTFGRPINRYVCYGAGRFIKDGWLTLSRPINRYVCYGAGRFIKDGWLTLGRPIGVRVLVRGVLYSSFWSPLRRWYFIASMRKSLQCELFLMSSSSSTLCTRYSCVNRGRRTCSISCEM